MTPITVAVPDDKIAFFKELVKSLHFSEIETPYHHEIEIPEWQKNIVRERVRTAKENPDSMLDWDKVKDTF